MGGGKGLGLFRGTQGSNMRERLLTSASHPRLKGVIRELYRQGATVGDGGTADAIRHEIATGGGVSGKSHIKKGQERLKHLKRILAEEKLCPQDILIIQSLIDDLTDALQKGRP